MGVPVAAWSERKRRKKNMSEVGSERKIIKRSSDRSVHGRIQARGYRVRGRTWAQGADQALNREIDDAT